MAEKQDFKYIVRVANTDLDGKKQVSVALRKIKGVGYIFANGVLETAKIEKNRRAGDLSNVEVEKLTDILSNPTKYKFPMWMFNRRKDYETGEDVHLLTTDLRFSLETDLKRLKMIKSNRGMRHAVRLPVRGQRTKSNFRRNKGKGSLGVKKKGGKDIKK